MWVPRVNFFLQFLVDVLPLSSVESHIYADSDPNPGSQNFADPTDPDPDQYKISYIVVISVCLDVKS